MLKSMNELDKPEFIMYMHNEPEDFESSLIYNIVKETNDTLYYKYKDEIDKQSDYQDYINTWIHEVKLPIQNIKNLTQEYSNEKLNNEIEYLTFLVGNSLTLAKINFSNFTFLINKVSMQKTINNIMKKNFNKINYANCEVELKIENVEVYIDEYWMDFIINQIIDNSIKYKATKLKITGSLTDNKYRLSIWDNGLGIYEDEIPYVFNKFYTGSHTKKNIASSGFGLYMVKQAVDELNININISSKIDSFTKVVLELPINNTMSEEEKVMNVLKDNFENIK